MEGRGEIRRDKIHLIGNSMHMNLQLRERFMYVMSFSISLWGRQADEVSKEREFKS